MPNDAKAARPVATVWPLQSDLAGMRKLYGNPDANGDGAADPAWVARYLTTIVPPYRMVYGNSVVRKITVNAGCAKAMLAALVGIKAHYGTQDAIERAGMHNFGGVYNFRAKRGNPNSLSMHAYACAIDLDPAHNPFQSSHGTMPAAVVQIFAEQGAEWGGLWSPASRDPMHFQFARTR